MLDNDNVDDNDEFDEDGGTYTLICNAYVI